MIQGDADAITTTATAVVDSTLAPTLRVPTYVAYVSPAQGFGVFCARAITKPRYANLDTGVASYGGNVCLKSELLHQSEAFHLLGTLPKRSEKEYVLNTLEAYIVSHHSPKYFELDGSDMRAGDGKFINHSCDPNVYLDANYHSTRLPPSPSSQETQVIQRCVYALIQPSRYECVYTDGVTYQKHASAQPTAALI